MHVGGAAQCRDDPLRPVPPSPQTTAILLAPSAIRRMPGTSPPLCPPPERRDNACKYVPCTQSTQSQENTDSHLRIHVIVNRTRPLPSPIPVANVGNRQPPHRIAGKLHRQAEWNRQIEMMRIKFTAEYAHILGTQPQ